MSLTVTLSRLPVLVASLAVSVAGAVLPLSPLSGVAVARSTDGSCASGTQSLQGEIRGSDGQHVDATLGFDLTDAAGHALDANGCPATSAGHAFMINPNYTVPAEGSAGQGTYSWHLDGIPANAVKVEIETYPRNPASSPRYQVTNTTYYARSMRHFALPTSAIVQVVLPRADTCPSADGIGSRTVTAYVVHWNSRTHRGSFTRDSVSFADAFSALPDRNNPGSGSPIQGLALGAAKSNGTVALAQLAAAPGKGQPYTFVVRTGHYGGRAYSTDYRGRQTFGVTACSAGTASVYEIPGSLSRAERHRLADYLYKHRSGFLVTNNR